MPQSGRMGKQGDRIIHMEALPMNGNVRRIAHGVLLVVGIVLMVGGIATGTHGASIIGRLVAAVNVQQYLSMKRRDADVAKGPTP